MEHASEAVHFNDFFSGVTVIDLASLGIGDRERNLVLVLFLNLYYEYMLNLEKRPYIGRDPQLRFIDSMLLVGRSRQHHEVQLRRAPPDPASGT